MSGPLIVTADLSPPDFAWLEGLRRAHYPPDRNRVPAHLTLFHNLPPSAELEVKRQLSVSSRSPPPAAIVTGPMNLGNGVAFRVASEDLAAIRQAMADHFHGLLSAQDAHGWHPHVTIQNKVAPGEVRELLGVLARDFRPRNLGIAALSLHRYLGGTWETLGRYPLRGR